MLLKICRQYMYIKAYYTTKYNSKPSAIECILIAYCNWNINKLKKKLKLGHSYALLAASSVVKIILR